MTGRARNQAIKNVVTMVAGVRRSKVRCRLGKGPDYAWAVVATPSRLPAEKCELVERELVARGLVGTYGDAGYEEPCVSFWSGR